MLSTLKPLHRALIVVLLFFASGSTIGILIFLPRILPPTAPCSVTIQGKILQGAPDQIHAMVERLLEERVSLLIGETRLGVTWKRLGAYGAEGPLIRSLHDLGAAGNMCSPSLAPAKMELPVRFDPEKLLQAVLQIKETVDRRPENAHLSTQDGSLMPHQEGRSLDLVETLSRIQGALRDGRDEVDLPIKTLSPLTTTDKLRGVDMKEVLGYFETSYSRNEETRDRTHNLLLGAQRLSGEIVMPGATWSFNGTLGDRTAANGFRYAPVISGGELVEGMGGGTCQVASTLHAAAFFAGMTIAERQPHSRPSAYIKLGMDATVAYPKIDLKIKNPFEFPVVIRYRAQGGVLRAELLGRERLTTVTFLRHIDRQTASSERTIERNDLPVGVRVVTQLGIPGFVVERFRIIQRGSVGVRERSQDKYPPTTQIVMVGTNPDLSSKDPAVAGLIPKPDPHPPYHADHGMRIIQGKDLYEEAVHD